MHSSRMRTARFLTVSLFTQPANANSTGCRPHSGFRPPGCRFPWMQTPRIYIPLDGDPLLDVDPLPRCRPPLGCRPPLDAGPPPLDADPLYMQTPWKQTPLDADYTMDRMTDACENITFNFVCGQ